MDLYLCNFGKSITSTDTPIKKKTFTCACSMYGIFTIKNHPNIRMIRMDTIPYMEHTDIFSKCCANNTGVRGVGWNQSSRYMCYNTCLRCLKSHDCTWLYIPLSKNKMDPPPQKKKSGYGPSSTVNRHLRVSHDRLQVGWPHDTAGFSPL